MMGKIIINNKSKMPDRIANLLVDHVMSFGFVSGENQYCWATSFKSSHSVDVFARKTRGNTHSFVVVDCDE